MPFLYLDNSDLQIPEGFTNWNAYWLHKGPGPLPVENAQIFLLERGCILSSTKRYRLGGRKWDDVDPEIRKAVDFLVEKGFAKGWTARIPREKPKILPPVEPKVVKEPFPKPEKIPRTKKEKKKKTIVYYRVKMRRLKQKIFHFRALKPLTFDENDCE